MNIRQATTNDLSRIAEIYVFNNRINYLPIFKDESYSFGKLQVVSIIDSYFKKEEVIKQLFVYDDGLIKGFIQVDHTEIIKLYVDSFFQNTNIGHKLLTYAMNHFHVNHVWVLEKYKKAISFYEKHNFYLTNHKQLEEGTMEFIVELIRLS